MVWLVWFVVFKATFNYISQLYRGCQFYWWRKPEYSEKTTNLLYQVQIAMNGVRSHNFSGDRY